MDFNIEDYQIYEYTYIDDFSCIRPLKILTSVFDQPIIEKDKFTQMIVALQTAFLNAGWEGDGEINVIPVPPFLIQGRQDGWCEYVFHVKQANNGISYLAVRRSSNMKIYTNN